MPSQPGNGAESGRQDTGDRTLDLPVDPSLHLEIADSFMRIPDYDRALPQYQAALEADRHNRAALAGAGRAAFELARFPLAERYLSAALSLNPTDDETAGLLKMAKAIPTIDAYEIRSRRERDRAVLVAFKDDVLRKYQEVGEDVDQQET